MAGLLIGLAEVKAGQCLAMMGEGEQVFARDAGREVQNSLGICGALPAPAAGAVRSGPMP